MIVKMEDLYKEISPMNFFSLCEIKEQETNFILFKPKHFFLRNIDNIEYEIKKSGNELIITDKGATFAYLYKTFFISYPDVIKNINKILSQTGIIWYGNEFFYKINRNEKFIPQILKYLNRINILYTMEIFYEEL